MKTLKTPFDCLQHAISPLVDKKSATARVVLLKRRLRRLKAGRAAAAKLVASFDRTLTLEQRKLDESQRRASVDTPSGIRPSPGLSMQALRESESPTQSKTDEGLSCRTTEKKSEEEQIANQVDVGYCRIV